MAARRCSRARAAAWGSIATIAVCLVLFGSATGRRLTAKSMQAAAPAPDAGLMSIMDSTEGAMMAVPSCSNADRYFAASMIPHHKGAVQMAQWELDHGSNPQLRNMSNSIITSQTQEIVQMQGYLPQLPTCAPSPAPAPAAMMSMGGMDMGGMQMDMSSPSPDMQMGMGSKNMMAPSSKAMSPSQMAFHRSMNMNMTTSLVGNPDRDFAVEMLSHHQAAVKMAQVEVQYGSFQPLVALARDIIKTQTQEIQEMRSILDSQYATSA